MATSRAPVNEEEFLAALYKGGELLAAGKIVDARGFLEKAHGLAPKNEKAQNLLGLTYFKLGLFDQASDIYEKLVNENPADATLRVNLGLVYLKTNNLPRCIKEFETATDLEPDHKKAHNYLGLALAQAGDYAKAKEHFILAGSDQMAEKMSRALTAKIESAPSSHGLVVPPAPPATAQAVTAKPAESMPVVSPGAPPPLPPPPLPPPAPPEEEIEVMSDSEVMDSDVISGEHPNPAPVEAPAAEVPVETFESAPMEAVESPIETVEVEAPPPPPEAFVTEAPPEPIEMPAEVEIAPPAPSGPRLERDWGAQFGMDADTAATESTVSEELPITEGVVSEELPVIEATAEVAPSPREWIAPRVNSWDAASGLTPPPSAPTAEPTMESTLDPAAEDPAWNAAKSASGEAPAPVPPVEAIAEEVPPEAPTAPVAAQDMSWNVPPDPNQEMNFADVAPTEATAAEPASDATSIEQSYTEQPYAEQPYTEQPVEQQYTEQPIEQQYSEQPVEQQYAEQPIEQQYAEQPVEQQYTEQAVEQQYTEHPVEQQYTEQPVEQQYAEQPVEQQYGEQSYSEQQYAEQSYAEQPAEQPAPEPEWVAQPLSQFTPENPPPPPPPSSPGRGYSPMEARTLVELGATTSDIEQPQAGPFHVGPHGLAVSVNGQMLTRMTNLVAIVGSVTAQPEHKRSRGKATEASFGDGPNQMQRLMGHGVVHLEMGSARFHALDLNDDSAYLREERVFGFEETIGFEHGRLAEDDGKLHLDLVHLSGDGRVLLQLNGAMKSLAVPPGEPMVVPLQRLVGWFGRVSPRLTGFAGQGAVELTGDGYALLVTPG